MIARLKLKPGQKGTKALVEKYGDALVCVRYRYDEASRTRIKTVELIVEKKELPPPKQIFSDESLVQVQMTRQAMTDDRLMKLIEELRDKIQRTSESQA